MSAYAIPQHEQTAQLLHPARDLSETGARSSHAVDRTEINNAPVIDALVDCVADRLAAALVARLGDEESSPQDEWFDSQTGGRVPRIAPGHSSQAGSRTCDPR